MNQVQVISKVITVIIKLNMMLITITLTLNIQYDNLPQNRPKETIEHRPRGK